MPENTDYPAAPEGSVRLNKFLASCGYESRRAADRLIQEGRVEVNGKVVDTPGLRVVPSDFVKVDGHRAEPKEEVVLLLNKPRGFICSREKQGFTKTVYDLLPPKYRYVNYVGRLDADSEGLLLFTNNGDLSRSLGHPAGGVEKEYWVTLDQAFDTQALLQLLKGVRIPEGQAKAKYVARLSPRRACVVLEQGLKRQVRQMFACLGLRVRKLVRVRIGSLWGGDLEPGHTALLTPEQVALAGVNPRPRKGMVSAKQAFKPKAKPVQDAAPEDEEEDYVFNPADFETEAEEPGFNTKFEEGEMFEPEREHPRKPFGKAPRGRVEFGDRKPFGERKFDGERRGFGDRKPFGERKFAGVRRGFGDRKPFGERKFDGERRGFGDRKPFGERKFDGERRGFGDRKSFGERRFDGERRGFGDRKSFGERKFDGERRGFGDRKPFGERKFDGERRGFGDRKPFGERKFDGERRGFGDRKPFGGSRKPFGDRKSFGNRRPGGPRGGRGFGR